MQALPRGGGGGGGDTRFQVMGMIEGFFGVGKFGKYFLGIQNNLNIRGSARITRPHSSATKVQPNLFSFLENFKARKFVMGFIWGYMFGPGIFFLISSSPSLEIQSTPSPWAVLEQHLASGTFCTFAVESTTNW